MHVGGIGECLVKIIHKTVGKMTDDGDSTVWFLESPNGYHWVYRLTDIRITDSMTAETVIRIAWWLLGNSDYQLSQGIQMCHFVLDYFGEGMCTLVALENAAC